MRVGYISLNLGYYVNLDDPVMVEAAESAIFADLESLGADGDMSKVVSTEETPDVNPNAIASWLIETGS